MAVPPLVSQSSGNWPWSFSLVEDWHQFDPQKLPCISVIIPSLNQAEYLEETILSVLNQDYPKTELIVVDGDSSDNSLEIIQKYSSKIAWFVSERDEGQAQAINKGWRKATGDVISWLNSDDRLAPGALWVVGSNWDSQGGFPWLSGACDIIDEKGALITRVRPRLGSLLEMISIWDERSFGLPQPSVFLDRQLLREIGYLNESYHYTMDHEYWMRLVQRGLHCKIINLPLSQFRLHPESKTWTMGNKFLGEEIRVAEGVIKEYQGEDRKLLAASIDRGKAYLMLKTIAQEEKVSNRIRLAFQAESDLYQLLRNSPPSKQLRFLGRMIRQMVRK